VLGRDFRAIVGTRGDVTWAAGQRALQVNVPAGASQDGGRPGLCPLGPEELESIDTWARGALRFVM